MRYIKKYILLLCVALCVREWTSINIYSHPEDRGIVIGFTVYARKAKVIHPVWVIFSHMVVSNCLIPGPSQ